MEELISVLIPCYNTEKYLAKCLDSVVNQTYTNLEILILNDGSTDNSLNIMNEYAKKDERINIISRENRGVAYSRNELIDRSKGNYIIFVDSDDTISLDAIKNLYEVLKETHCEIAMCNVDKVYEGENVDLLKAGNVSGYKEYSKLETIFNLISVGAYYDYPVAKLYSRSALDNIKFPLNRIYEDSATVFKIYYNADKTVLLDNVYYHYLVGREDSITNKKYTSKNLNDNYLAINERYSFLTEHVPTLINEIKMGYIRNTLTLVERVYCSDNQELINSDIVKELIANLRELYFSISDYKNKNKILSNYHLSCLYYLLNNDLDTYSKMIAFVKK
jgi:glycosyltransferase involved in cell wall biosynthesis